MTKSIAVVAAHPDDEVLGCGGTLARLAAEGHSVNILLVADGESSRRGGESALADLVDARNEAAKRACKTLGCYSVEVINMPDNRLDGVVLLEIVQRVEGFLSRHQASVVFTHHRGDVNVDHQVVHDAVVAACRPVPGQRVQELFFFEVPSSTEWRPAGSAMPFHPNWFVDISATLSKKLDALSCYKEELREYPHPRSLQGVEALARWRGATVGVNAAEAFVLGRKLVAE